MQETLIKRELKEKGREILFRTRGSSHGPITRLVSPSDLGQAIKPFVFLDYFDIDPKRMPPIDFHPHPGSRPRRSSCRDGCRIRKPPVPKDSLMREASNGCTPVVVYGTVAALPEWPIKGYQLWIALPPEEENSDSEARYVDASRLRKNGPARVILGRYGNVASEVHAPGASTTWTLHLKKGGKWRYEPPSGHTVAWAAVHEGELAAPAIGVGELLSFA
jgi:redox-sensitive bicupin YhaK (pirin superfamily)